MLNVGPAELVVVLIIALLVLGPKKLPEVGRSVGKGVREFRGALRSAAGQDDPISRLRWDDENENELFGPDRHRGEEEPFDRVQEEEEAAARRSF